MHISRSFHSARAFACTVAIVALATACGAPAGGSTGSDPEGDTGPEAGGLKSDTKNGGGKDSGTDGPTDGSTLIDGTLTDGSAGGAETIAGDTGALDTPDGCLADCVDAVDVGSDAVGACDFPVNPAAGESGAACKTADDCDSGFCIDGPNGKICTSACISCCPAGFECGKMAGIDGAFACLPKQMALCQPCQTDAECGKADPGALCVPYGQAGSFCGSGCSVDADCPGGYACQDAAGQLGAAKQCVRQQGECACTKWGSLAGATTKCTASNDFGACQGVRKCGIVGLTPCSAPTPATETCNGVDDNCDGTTDPTNADGCTPYYTDGDGDGFGGGKGKCVCVDPGSGTTQGGDCNDQSAATKPGAKEVCDGLDNDCDGLTDPGFPDSNGDGFADCVDPDIDGDGVANASDCAPANSTVYPGAKEGCDGLDNDCNGITDDPGATGCTLWYQDNDGDGSGAGLGQCICDVSGTFTAAVGGDCNDSNGAIHPGATEVCNDADDNCSGQKDEGCDDDLDLWCDATMTVSGTPSVCPSGKQDCNDAIAGVHPEQADTCGNGVDDNCDGLTDSGDQLSGCITFYADNDVDGYGDKAQSQCLCTGTSFFTVKIAGDCDDGNADLNPKATEVCNNKDDDCDGTTDVKALDCTVLYADADSDAYGAVGDSQCLCGPTGTYTATTGGDCNDAIGAIHPKTDETCNGLDDDCDGFTDPPNSGDCSLYFKDTDADGYGNVTVSSKCLCGGIDGYAASGGDCDDNNNAVHPSATEICNGMDDNCDDAVDPLNTSDCTTYYLDGDSDGYGSKFAQCTCAATGGYTALNPDDCDDNQGTVNPKANEFCDGMDNDCDSLTDEDLLATYYADGDSDGYGVGTGNAQCGPSQAFPATLNGDCDDASEAIHPLAQETCNAIDDDCDGETDEGLALAFWFADSDKDGYGNSAIASESCAPVPGSVLIGGDCDDGDAAIHPGLPDGCDGKDNDCNGGTDEGLAVGTWWPDGDSDSYGDSAGVSIAGCQKTGYVANNTDCDDTKAGVNSAGTEVCNSVDDNCDGATDEIGGCQTCSATTVNALDKTADFTNDSIDWIFDADGEFTATSGTKNQYLRWGASSGNGYYGFTNEKATIPFTLPANAAFVAIDVAFDNTYDTNTPDTKLYMTLNFDGSTQQIGPFTSLHGMAWFTVTWPVSAAQQGKAKTIIATVQSAQTNNVQAGGIALDFVRAISGCTDTSSFCAPANAGGLQSKTVYTDNDADGYGDPTSVTTSCNAAPNTVSIGGDCNDSNLAIYPSAAEVCDGLDNDCNGGTDDLAGAVLNPLDSSIDYVSEPGNWWSGKTWAKTQGAGAQWWGDSAGCGYGVGTAQKLTFNVKVPTGAQQVAMDVYFDNRRSVSPETPDTTAKMVITFNGMTRQIGPFATVQSPKWRTIAFPVVAGDYGKTYLAGASMTTTANTTTYGTSCTAGSAGGFGLDNVRSIVQCGNTPPACSPGVAASNWYLDTDGDGYGSDASAVSACIQPAGTIAAGGDCDDAGATVNPGASEVACNSIDDNCNGATDDVNGSVLNPLESSADYVAETYNWWSGRTYTKTQGTAAQWCGDSSGCGYPKLSDNVTFYATVPTGASGVALDVYFDNRLTVGPDTPDTSAKMVIALNGVKQQVGPFTSIQNPKWRTLVWPMTATDWGKKYTFSATVTTATANGSNGKNCTGGSAGGFALDNARSLIVCGGGAPTCTAGVTASNWYMDGDGDGYGDANSLVSNCIQPAGYIATGGDCDDTSAAINPGVKDICGTAGVDDNCDGITDGASSTGCSNFYTDADGDSYGTGTAVCLCASGTGYAAANGDCNDNDAAVKPGAAEVCDGVDNDCSGTGDVQNTAGCQIYFLDTDKDGFGVTASSQCWCTAQTTYSTLLSGDCNDTNSAINPGKAEACNSLDDNCDTAIDEGLPTGTWYKDADGDKYGNLAQTFGGCQAAGYVADSTDCNDAAVSIYPGATETCNLKDDNCDGATDEGLVTGVFYKDADSDTYGDPTTQLANSCQLSGYVANFADCDDTKLAVNPGATEVCYDSLDNNCSGATDEGCPACVSTLLQGFNASTSNVTVGDATFSNWLIGTKGFTPTEGVKALIYGGTSGYSTSSSLFDKVTVTFTIPTNSPYLTLDYVLINAKNSTGGIDPNLKIAFTFNGQTQTVGPFLTVQANAPHQLTWTIPQAMWGTTQQLTFTPTAQANGYVLSGIMVDNLRTTCP